MWQWEFGDGISSTLQNPSHIYNYDGSYTVRLTASNEFGTNTKTKTNYVIVGTGGGEPCPGTPTVIDADGNLYNTVLIGEQCWMKENLNVGTRIDGSQEMTTNSMIEKYCYDDDPANCDIYGGLYQWNEMMQYTTIEGTKGICPDGWHLPTDDEWKQMEMVLGMSQSEADEIGWRGESEGGKMKETGTTHWNSPNTDATNSSGFTAIPGGGINYSSELFKSLYYRGDWWSSSEYSVDTKAWSRALYYNIGTAGRGKNDKTHGFSVRCIKD